MATAKKSAKKSTAKKTAVPGEKEESARNRENAARRAAGKPDTSENHDANPDVATDSSVRHAEPQTGKQAGEGHGGYPSGEYDVTPPKPTAAAKTKDPLTAILEQSTEQAGGADASQALVERTKQNAQLTPDQFDQAVEELPVGTIIEHEGPNRWRVHVIGRGRYGHGATHSEAVENFITGASQTTAQTEADRALANLPAKQQQEIADRDAKAAKAVGGTAPDTFARIENAKAQAADQKAALPAPNANTDGPEKASARVEAATTSTEDDGGYTASSGDKPPKP